ncbi:DUF4245 domain-containing protein [Compostimonas suwonensis]|uniref:Uncharacterized protein DUF4245 n=1 Tax=Compostimonas suwonensis TaxID=1048394 RepID=A0A2M9BW93_9MICO|nr:DUF4245 domain-containing protein [Compostimonas suwonensis]PJJ62221.1 uncharacterized protein DUF4245 [Compostimonas suwonensis]
MSPTKPPRIVAELGRPETPEETAARKAENSRNHRNRQTLNNLVASLLATVGLAIVIVLLVPRNDNPIDRSVDYAAVAVDAQRTVDETALSPELPGGWSANAAEVRTGGADGIEYWYIGFITPKDEFVGLTQGFDTNPTWLDEQVAGTLPSATTTIDGRQWDVYDNRGSDDVGNVEYALVTQTGADTIVLFGTAGDAEFETLASAVSAQLDQQR